MAKTADKSDKVAAFDSEAYIHGVGSAARAAAVAMARASTRSKNEALSIIARNIEAAEVEILAANAQDLARAGGLENALVERLTLNPGRVRAMADGLKQVADLADPVGETTDMRFRPSGIQVGQMRVPIGVVGIIYESRPNVTADAAALCLKAGNAAILRGGSEAIRSNTAIAGCIVEGLVEAGLPDAAVQVLGTTERPQWGRCSRHRSGSMSSCPGAARG